MINWILFVSSVSKNQWRNWDSLTDLKDFLLLIRILKVYGTIR